MDVSAWKPEIKKGILLLQYMKLHSRNCALFFSEDFLSALKLSDASFPSPSIFPSSLLPWYSN